mgnify:CR=1 FL=1
MNFATLFNALPGACAQGLIWGIMAIGVYTNYKILEIIIESIKVNRMQKLLNFIAFYIIIGETMWKINTIGDLSGLSKTAWRGRRADYCN